DRPLPARDHWHIGVLSALRVRLLILLELATFKLQLATVPAILALRLDRNPAGQPEGRDQYTKSSRPRRRCCSARSSTRAGPSDWCRVGRNRLLHQCFARSRSLTVDCLSPIPSAF